MTSRPLRMMFLSRHSLLDRTSGAALTLIELMRRATRRGVPTRVVTGTVLDVNPPRAPQEADFAPWGQVTKDSFNDFDLWRCDYQGVETVMLATQSTGGRRLTQAETDALEDLWEREVEAFQPDVVVMYCGFDPERRMLARLGKRGVKRVLHLANGNYKHAAVFNEVDLIETTSNYLRNFYHKLDGIEPWVGAPVIDPGTVVAERHEPRYITFINPAPAKGATLFYQLAGLAAQQLPQAEFLVVESRGHAKSLRDHNGLDLRALPNVTVWPHQQDMRKVYRKTKILLMPSFWVECFGRIVVEAGWNGIPTIAANQGGIPEAMNGGGMLLPVPNRCYQQHNAMPTPTEVQPWLDAIAHWMSDADAYAAASRRARAGAAAFDPDRVVSAILDRFNRLTEGHDIGRAPSQWDKERAAERVAVHLDGGAGLSMLHPALQGEGWREIRLSPGAGAGAATEPPYRLLAPLGEGCATAVQAEDVLTGLSAETAAQTLQGMSRVLKDDGYAVLSLRDGEPFNREQLTAAAKQAGFQQSATTETQNLSFRCILSKSARSQEEWNAISPLIQPPRDVMASAGNR